MEIFRTIKDMVQGKLNGKRRSPKWPATRQAHLKTNPNCAVCGSKKKLQVHHKQPFHLHPELELEPTNLITLCELKKGGVNCHLFVGHLGNYKRINPGVEMDAQIWSSKLKK